MNKKTFIYTLLAALIVAMPSAELQAVKQTTKRSRIKKTANTAQNNQVEQAKTEEIIAEATQSNEHQSSVQQEITTDASEQIPTISQTWGKVLRLKWTSLNRQDAKNIGLTFIAGAVAGYGIYSTLTYEFAPSRHIPDYYPPTTTSNRLGDCPICIDSITPRTEKRLSCGHTYCEMCLTQHIDGELKQQRTTNMRCPDPSCNRRALTPSEIKYILNNNLSKMNIYYNIRLNEYNARNNRSNTHLDLASTAWVNKHTKQCPQCKASIEKNGGCKHMTCSRCYHEFCWECLVNWRYRVFTGHYGYYDCPKEKISYVFSGIGNLFS